MFSKLVLPSVISTVTNEHPFLPSQHPLCRFVSKHFHCVIKHTKKTFCSNIIKQIKRRNDRKNVCKSWARSIGCLCKISRKIPVLKSFIAHYCSSSLLLPIAAGLALNNIQADIHFLLSSKQISNRFQQMTFLDGPAYKVNK